MSDFERFPDPQEEVLLRDDINIHLQEQANTLAIHYIGETLEELVEGEPVLIQLYGQTAGAIKGLNTTVWLEWQNLADVLVIDIAVGDLYYTIRADEIVNQARPETTVSKKEIMDLRYWLRETTWHSIGPIFRDPRTQDQ
jgi:hypothetical protein